MAGVLLGVSSFTSLGRGVIRGLARATSGQHATRSTATTPPGATSLPGSSPGSSPSATAATDPGGATADPTATGATGATGAALVPEAIKAYRAALGSKDPSAVELTVYLSADSPRAIALMQQKANPNLADEYDYEDGVVMDPKAPMIVPDNVHAAAWPFSAVAWSKVASMLQTTERVCRGAMRRGNIPDEADSFGDKAGLSHMIVERDAAFYGGKVIVRVYFDGGARWDGGYVPFYANGTKITDRYCTIS